ncbi:MAG: serine hydrolase [Patescibacteria group bacterium]
MSFPSDNNFLANNEISTPKIDRWRNWFFVLVLLAGAGYLSLKPFLTGWVAGAKIKIEAVVISNLKISKTASVGGDKVVLPPPLPKPPTPTRRADSVDLVEPFTARAIMARDLASGYVLFAKNEYQKWPLASVTKLLSALVLLDMNFDFATTTVSATGELADSYVAQGVEYQAEDFWLAALVASSNRSIMSLAVATGLTEDEFVAKINAKAKELGMPDTHLEDPTGLDPDNTTTASDAATLIAEAVRHDKIRMALLTREINLADAEGENKLHIWNTDWLLLNWIPNQFLEFNGGKTGYIAVSDYNFVMQVGDGNGHLVNIAVLGAESHEARFVEAKKVAEWVFESFEWVIQ